MAYNTLQKRKFNQKYRGEIFTRELGDKEFPKIKRSLFGGFLDERRKEFSLSDKVFSRRGRKRIRMSSERSPAIASAGYDEIDLELKSTFEDTLRSVNLFPCEIRIENMQGKVIRILCTTTSTEKN